MPENRTEWGILGIGLVVLAVLGAVIGLDLRNERGNDERATAAQTVRQASPAAPLAPPVTTTQATASAAPTPPAKAAKPKPKPKPEVQVKAKPKTAPKPETTPRQAPQPDVRLRLSATRGDSWLEVRADSSSGTVLFSGTLARGATRTFRAERLWVRFGGASNLDARLNGRTLGLRFGTYDALVTASGLAQPS